MADIPKTFSPAAPRIAIAGKRQSRSRRGYTRAHYNLCAIEQAETPLCRDCKRAGILRAATETDHIDGDAYNNDPRNRVRLCKSCHAKKTRAQQRQP